MVFFTELEQKFSQFVWKHKRTRIAKAILIKKNGDGGINLSDQIILQSYIIMTVWYCHKNRNIDQLNKIESPEINLVPSTLPLTRKARIYNGERQPLQ